VDAVRVHRPAGRPRSLDQEVREAAVVDGASRWQSFVSITAAILPVVTTIVLIR
jgi:ABC-type sugar transport system permease subunit